MDQPVKRTIAHMRYPELNEERFDLQIGGGSVGYAATIDCGHEIWIAELWVHPGHRGQGLAASLLDAVFARHVGHVLALAPEPFEEHDRTGAPAPAGPTADELAAWYARLGFRRDGASRMVRLAGIAAVPA